MRQYVWTVKGKGGVQRIWDKKKKKKKKKQTGVIN